MFEKESGRMKVTVDLQMFVPTAYYGVNGRVGMMQLFGMEYDGFICIFQKIRQYCSQYMVTIVNFPVKIKVR